MIKLRLQNMRAAAKRRGVVVPSMEELLAMVPADMKCPCCGRDMVWTTKLGTRADVISLQHYSNGAIGMVCYSCNSRMRHLHDDIPPEGWKLCAVCKVTKKYEAFRPSAKGFAGRDAWCAACTREYNKQYNQRKKA
jgi:hypothetical protein